MTLEQDLNRKTFTASAEQFRADILSAVLSTTIMIEEIGGSWPERGSSIILRNGNAFAQFDAKAPEDVKGNAVFLRGLWVIGVRTNLDATEHLFFCAKDGWRLPKGLADYRGRTEGIERLFDFVRSLLAQAGLPFKAKVAQA